MSNLDPASLLRWLQRKKYQYEVTFSLYMLTPTEKFVLNSIIFLVLSLFTIGLWVYLPDHIGIMYRRIYYYASGALPSAPATMAVVNGSVKVMERVATTAAARVGGKEL